MEKTKKAGKLQVKLLENRKALGEAAAAEAVEALKAVIEQKGCCYVIFAAAPSQNEFLAALCASDVDWTKVYAYHMDEYIGLPEDAPQGFGNFLRRSIFEQVSFAGVEYLNGAAENVEEEMKRYEALLKKNPPDIVFMGIGENGHIAFNDPHVAHFDDADLVKKVELDHRCRMQQVHDGCFEKLDLVPRQALTLTIPALISAEYAFCIVPAPTKAEAVKRTLEGAVCEACPASILRRHPQAVLYLDGDSASKLSE